MYILPIGYSLLAIPCWLFPIDCLFVASAHDMGQARAMGGPWHVLARSRYVRIHIYTHTHIYIYIY